MRKHTTSLAVLASIVLMACEPGDPATGPLSPTFDHKGSPHGGKGGGGGGDDESHLFDLDITGSVLASEVSIEVGRDNNKSISMGFPSGTWNMSATRQSALDEIANPDNDDQCQFSSGIDDATKTALADVLLAARVDGELGVDKRRRKGSIRFRNQPDNVWSSWGFNTQTEEPGGADIDADGTDWNDASATRRFLYSGGFIRVLMPGAPNETADSMTCRVQAGDGATVVLTPQ